MSVMTTGAELKKFYNDKTAWPTGVWHEDEELEIDGVAIDRDKVELDIGKDIEDTAKVKVAGGFLMDDTGKDLGTFENHFKKWRKAQTSVFVSVEIPKDKEEAVLAAIKAAGGRVV